MISYLRRCYKTFVTEVRPIRTLTEEKRYKIRDRIRQRQSDWKGALKAMQSMEKGLHKVFRMVAKEISQELTALGI